METQEQPKKQYDWLKGYQFVKGQSGNPGGRPKGRKSMKTFVREYFEALPDEEKIEFIKTIPNAVEVWKMGEGAPENKTTVKDMTTEVFSDEELEVARQIIAKRLASDSASEEGGGD